MSKREKLADQVIARLQEQISLGKWKKGDKIPAEPELMAVFRVGRSTIREAIKTLAKNGVLTVQQGNGTFVNDSTQLEEPLEQRLRRAAQEELNQVRTIVEREIIRLAIKNHTATHIRDMQQALHERRLAVEADNYEAAINADIRFHTTLAIASSNSVLADLFASFSHVLRTSFQRRDEGSVVQFGQTHILHEQLLQAVAGKNETAALAAFDALLDYNL
ncbi:FadR/GntR family transcriptional regulator [Chitinophaga sp. Cy-1792]|uniref:FadR/GntR family transcriptional regulator n=1 Tax=Chitinophaga sp. Cy-1792 TaxID=2608339 RepID=UPI001421E50F|nr:GntR family transcriptional regulator [Chitinophaga sp. Cy-1792]